MGQWAIMTAIALGNTMAAALMGAVTQSTTGPTATGTVSSFGVNADQTITYETNGDIEGSANGVEDLGNWYTPLTTSIGTSYWIRCTYISGDTVYTSGAGLASWLQLNSARAWLFRNSAAGPDIKAGVYRFEIATDSGGSNVVGSRDTTITLEVESP